MDIPAPSENDATTEAAINIPESIPEQENAILGDPLAGMDIDNIVPGTGGTQKIVANDTIDTSDDSIVGDLEKIRRRKKIEPAFDPLAAFSAPNLGLPTEPEAPKDEEKTAEATDDLQNLAIENMPIVEEKPAENDPEKDVFIKTYTEEFDQTLRRATEATSKILRAIDDTIREHLPEISIPREADEFIEEPPTGHKVSQFNSAQDIIKTIMTKANEAKSQSTAAAEEAAKVYDEVQNFKKQTEKQIDDLTKDMDLDELKKLADEEEKTHSGDFAKEKSDSDESDSGEEY